MQRTHDAFTSKTKLAGIYLDDGAPRSAARILRELADDLELNQDRREREFFEKIGIKGTGK